MANHYRDDREIDSFRIECLHFKQFMEAENIIHLLYADKYIRTNEPRIHCTFPNLEVAMRIYFTIPITNCSAERGFTALKRIKSIPKSCLQETKLTITLYWKGRNYEHNIIWWCNQCICEKKKESEKKNHCFRMV